VNLNLSLEKRTGDQMKKIIIVAGLFLILFIMVGCGGSSDTSLETKKQTVVAVVHSVATGLSATLKDYTTEVDRTNYIRAFVDPITFYPDKTGYLFVYNYECLNVALPNPKDLEGQNLYNHADSHGNYPIRQLADTAKNGGGYVEYYWIKPGSDSTTEQRKISYVEPIPGTDYFIGAGVYTGK
jgi:signal transduction histidine kinase